MKIIRLINGNLEMSLEKDLPRFKKDFSPVQLGKSAIESIFIRKWLEPLGYSEIKPEDCGALTSASLITDGKDVWGDMQYQVASFLENLANGKTVVWQKG